VTAPGQPTLVRRRVVVHGRVQGVGFRMACARRAEALGLAGHVGNRADGTVEAVFEGPEAAVQAMVEWCRRGPPMSRVDRLEVHSEAPTAAHGFGVA